MSKAFYDEHMNFAGRTLTEYCISPGIKCKFDTIIKRLGRKHRFPVALDVGCSGNSILCFMETVGQRCYCDLAQLPLEQYTLFWHSNPACGSITQMPYPNDTFDLVTALDVLEHIPDDQSAANDIVRVLRPGGYLVVTVPHRMKYFTNQDTLCGHCRRYEYPQIRDMFVARGLRQVMRFPVYGQIMKIQMVQEGNPEKTEQALADMRKKYASDRLFRRLWDRFVAIGAKVMALDAAILPFQATLDICIVFRKPRT
jgi:SAM-dependent methyltransferase